MDVVKTLRLSRIILARGPGASQSGIFLARIRKFIVMDALNIGGPLKAKSTELITAITSKSNVSIAFNSNSINYGKDNPRWFSAAAAKAGRNNNSDADDCTG